MTWDILKQIKLRKLEYRMRNVDELRLMMMEHLNDLTKRHEKDQWDDLRALATGILVEAEAVLEEAVAIGIELELLQIPEHVTDAQATNLRIANHADFLVEKVKPVRNTVAWLIEAEDARRH